ncbi:PaaI family thioesterase [Luteibaculum oceani]|nr:PaaI family thioesterase [Luteibaculum oceani]
MYLSAPINKIHFPSTAIEISDGSSIITINLDESYHHTARAGHGSVYFKLLDDASFFAANSKQPNYFVLTQSFALDFIKPIFEGKLTAIGKFIKEEAGKFYAESELFNNQNELVGKGSGVFAISKIPLNSIPEYQETVK